MEKNRNQILHHLPSQGDMMEDDVQDFRQYAKDQKLAREDPQRYCADRCVATGNCDVYEDFFELGPEEVLAFCTDCVLSDDKEECVIPAAFYKYGVDDDDVKNAFLP